MKWHLLAVVLLVSLASTAQSKKSSRVYRYEVDLNRLTDDKISVQLSTPAVKGKTALFSFPQIIPGTYQISNYGKFISDVKAFNSKGKELAVTKLNENQWEISDAGQLSRITYAMEDIFDTKLEHNVYPMSATNIEEGKNIVLNTPGVFGFIEGQERLPFELSFTKPDSLYASTSLKPTRSTPTKDIFSLKDLDELYDSPIMYSVPDTATRMVGNCQVLVSVYAPRKTITASRIIGWLDSLLMATSNYLGGKLPVDKYAFIYYFKDPSLKHAFAPGLGGALEHNTSSFYYLYETPGSITKGGITDISSHEFFHIITPLTIASKEVKQFNWNKAVMSKHLWLYEGVTEYTSHLVQVQNGLKTQRQFLNTLENKITNSQAAYNDTLPFTELSLQATGKHASQYNNVYEKGAMIAACLDIYLLHLSKGKYGLRELEMDLGKKFGKDRYFNDNELFDIITKMTYPEVRNFFRDYVEGNKPLPYADFLNLAGIRFTPYAERKGFSLGGINLVLNQHNRLIISNQSNFNEFGKAMGYQKGDVLHAVNGTLLSLANVNTVLGELRDNTKEGDPMEVIVLRKKGETVDTVTLSSKYFHSTLVDRNKMELLPNPTDAQVQVQQAWLKPEAARRSF